MAQNPSYREIHAYMLQKTQEYYQNPPEALIQAVIAEKESRGETVSRQEAKKLVSLIDIQRYLKEEMTRLWPEFMGGIPSNSLRDR